ncbi:unnamed protein product [Acanthoscelides obtectus]|uniref:Uncharacterized protein n=1 Tax=Acanthoscelides obtectus TaxID=200917 RepID=A0A9P0KQ08_ACAOB|nr:unnamed protein product [Acanthoscelides obtectus]CAK1628301.1 hypothetical protein AOBTE_LOCUS5120 [Acanthoscelides obtectus]
MTKVDKKIKNMSIHRIVFNIQNTIGNGDLQELLNCLEYQMNRMLDVEVKLEEKSSLKKQNDLGN